MTRHKALHTGLVSPSPLDLLINALLHAFAMLVSHVAHLCSMRLIRHSAECHSDATLEVLPCTESGKLKETTQAAASNHTRRGSASSSNAVATAPEGAIAREALMVSRSRSDRPSNHEGVLRAPSTSHPRPCAEDLGCRGGGTLTNPHQYAPQTMSFRAEQP